MLLLSRMAPEYGQKLGAQQAKNDTATMQKVQLISLKKSASPQSEAVLLRRNLLLLGTFYIAFAFFYMLILHWSVPPQFRIHLNWRILYLDYPLKALFILPIWYVIFRQIAHRAIWERIGLMLLLLPVWTKGWQQTYYFIVDENLGGNHLEGAGQWWDIYIPALFYCIQFGGFFAYEYHEKMRESERKQAESERLALTSELATLKAQLNPHFLYNAFNTISASVPPEQEATRELIAELSDMFRYQLKASREDLVTLGEELDFIQDYLTLEKARFGQRLKVEVAVEKWLRSAAIPPMILQPLVENAVKHGIAPLVEGGTIRLEAFAKEARLHCSISDSGLGLDPKAVAISDGFGLSNTRKRLSLLYDSPLHIRSSSNGGTHLTFDIPLQYVTKSNTDR